jgi:carbon monoxide dehydrogenase subunit G
MSMLSLRREGKGILAEVEVAASPERVWKILTSFDEMSAHLGALEKSRLLSRKGNYSLVEQSTHLEVPLFSLSLRVLLDVVAERPFLYFKQREGSFTEFSGYWRVDSEGDGERSRIRYYVEVDLPGGLRRLAADWHLRRMVQRNLEDLTRWIQGGERRSST